MNSGLPQGILDSISRTVATSVARSVRRSRPPVKVVRVKESADPADLEAMADEVCQRVLDRLDVISIARGIHDGIMAKINKRLTEHLKGVSMLIKSMPVPQVNVAATELHPHINLPEQPPSVVNFAPVVNVPESHMTFSPQVLVPELQPVMNFAPVVNVPQQPAPVVEVRPNFQIPEQPASIVNFAPVVNVPEQAAPNITVQAPNLRPIFNVPEQAPPVVNVQASEVKVSPIFSMDIPKRTTTTKSIQYEGSRPKTIVEQTTTED